MKLLDAIAIIREKRPHPEDIVDIVISEVKKWDDKTEFTEYDRAIEKIYKELNQ
jgi:hypothetical protein